MNRIRSSSLVVLAAIGLSLAPARAADAPATPSLYKRIGGYDAIAAVVDDFVPRLVADARLGKFFQGHSSATMAHIRQRVIEQICMAAGGPCIYTGRDMKTAHKGLGITEEDWTAAVMHLTATFDKLKVPAKEKDELLAIVSALKKDIVEAPAAGSGAK